LILWWKDPDFETIRKLQLPSAGSIHLSCILSNAKDTSAIGWVDLSLGISCRLVLEKFQWEQS
jgi:hypothetical protein